MAMLWLERWYLRRFVSRARSEILSYQTAPSATISSPCQRAASIRCMSASDTGRTASPRPRHVPNGHETRGPSGLEDSPRLPLQENGRRAEAPEESTNLVQRRHNIRRISYILYPNLVRYTRVASRNASASSAISSASSIDGKFMVS